MLVSIDDINAEPAISIRKNASTRSKGCPLRKDEVLLIKKLGYDGWKQLKDAGREDGYMKLSFPHWTALVKKTIVLRGRVRSIAWG